MAGENLTRVGTKPWLLFALAISTFAIVFIFASGFVGGGVARIKLGIMLAIIAFGSRLAMFYLQPLPGKLIGYWIVGDLIAHDFPRFLTQVASAYSHGVLKRLFDSQSTC